MILNYLKFLINLKVELNKIYSNLSKDLNIKITNPNEANKYIQDERYKRFNELIKNKIFWWSTIKSFGIFWKKRR